MCSEEIHKTGDGNDNSFLYALKRKHKSYMLVALQKTQELTLVHWKENKSYYAVVLQ